MGVDEDRARVAQAMQVRVKRIRKLRGMTTAELGRRVHPRSARPSRMILNIEQGHSGIQLWTAAKIARVLLVPLGWLVGNFGCDSDYDDIGKG